MEKKQKRFQRLTFNEDACPWCSKKGIKTSAKKKSVMHVCANRCGYKVFIPKQLLRFEERIKYYDPKRYKRDFTPILTS